MGGLTKNGIV